MQCAYQVLVPLGGLIHQIWCESMLLPFEELIFLICFHFSTSSQRQHELSAFPVCAESTT